MELWNDQAVGPWDAHLLPGFMLLQQVAPVQDEQATVLIMGMVPGSCELNPCCDAQLLS